MKETILPVKRICGIPSGDWVYVIGAEKEADAIAGYCTDTGLTLCFVPCLDWNRDLSPWQAPGSFPGGGDFSGGASAYLRQLTEEVLPNAEGNEVPRRRYLVGYSLAGLFSLWALYQTGLFSGAASVSGSLWFDGFMDYVRTHSFVHIPEGIVLSVGGKEKNTKNSRIQTVEVCTRQIGELYRGSGIDTHFTLHPGGHFANVEYRIAHGICTLTRAALSK